jgi:WhiB family redox-sensing transcriptional regulator
MMTYEEVSQAACKDMDTNIFYSGMTGRYANELTAKAVCIACPVRMQCLQQALENDELGIWGGTTELERKSMRRKQARSNSIFIKVLPPQAMQEAIVKEERAQRLAESNERRAAAASAQLRMLLAEAKERHGAALPPSVITMVEWKIANPTMSYADIGTLMTPVLTKDQAAGLVRRWIKGKR